MLDMRRFVEETVGEIPDWVLRIANKNPLIYARLVCRAGSKPPATGN